MHVPMFKVKIVDYTWWVPFFSWNFLFTLEPSWYCTFYSNCVISCMLIGWELHCMVYGSIIFIKFYGSLNLQVHVNDDSAICFCLSLVPDFWGNFTAQGMDFFFLNCQCYYEKQIDNNDIVFMVYTLKDLRNTIKLCVQDFSVNQSPRARVFWPHDHEIF